MEMRIMDSNENGHPLQTPFFKINLSSYKAGCTNNGREELNLDSTGASSQTASSRVAPSGK